MSDCATIQKEIANLLGEKLALEVPSVDSDLIETGILDSMKFVELLTALEQHFGTTISLDALELDSFRSIARIAEFVLNQENGAKNIPEVSDLSNLPTQWTGE